MAVRARTVVKVIKTDRKYEGTECMDSLLPTNWAGSDRSLHVYNMIYIKWPPGVHRTRNKQNPMKPVAVGQGQPGASRAVFCSSLPPMNRNNYNYDYFQNLPF